MSPIFLSNKFGLYYKLLYVCVEIDGYEKVFFVSRDIGRGRHH